MRHYILEEAVKKTGANQMYKRQEQKDKKKEKRTMQANFVNLNM
jgi:hypothetical protein